MGNIMSVTLIKKSLEALEKALKSAQLWDSNMPTPAQLSSREPFCVDTLAFEQWLQWVFIPKLSALISSPNFAGMPNQSDTHTMAEYAFKDYEQDTSAICSLIKRIDEALNQF